MKIKKLLGLLSAAVMLAGCASEGSSPWEDSSTTGTSSAAVTSAAAEESETPSEAESSSAADSSSEAASSEAADSSSRSDKQTSDITPLMWEVTSENGGRLVLMGSIHVLKKEAYPLPDSLTGALEAADALAVECDVIKSATDYSLELKQVQNMKYPDGETIDDHISAEVLEGARAYAKELGTDLSVRKSSKPWVYNSLLESLTIQKAGLYSKLGIDRNLLELAKQTGKEIIEIESSEFQVDLIMSFSDRVSEAQLSSYRPENTDALVKDLEDHYTAWCRGDISFFEERYDTDKILASLDEQDEEVTPEDREAVYEYIEKMFISRNRNMADKAEQLLKEGRNVFYVVGEAHFIGSKGILNLLKEAGYEVKQLQP